MKEEEEGARDNVSPFGHGKVVFAPWISRGFLWPRRPLF
jgi:hypothetical protein